MMYPKHAVKKNAQAMPHTVEKIIYAKVTYLPSQGNCFVIYLLRGSAAHFQFPFIGKHCLLQCFYETRAGGGNWPSSHQCDTAEAGSISTISIQYLLLNSTY